MLMKIAATDVGVLLSGSAELTSMPKAARAAKLRFSCHDVGDLFGTDESAHDVGLGLHRERAGLDRHRFGGRANLQLHVLAQRTRHIQDNPAGVIFLKTLGVYVQRIGADFQIGKCEQAGAVGGCRPGVPGAGFGQLYGRAGHHVSGRVGYDAVDFRVLLCCAYKLANANSRTTQRR